MWWRLLLLVGMSGVIAASFILPAPQQAIGDASRIFYYHVPIAWVSTIAFALSAICSIRYLRKRTAVEDDRAVTAAAIGLLFCVLATISGSVFARVTWGSFWNWDPRQSSIFILLLIYGAYFALRGAVEIPETRAALSAVYAVFAFMTVPFLVLILPRVVPSLHPGNTVFSENLKLSMGPAVRAVFFASLAVFTVLFLWIFSLARRVHTLTRLRQEEA